MFAAEIKKRRVHHRLFSNWRWHLDEVFVRINGELNYLWQAVDHEGEVLESLVTKRPNRGATLTFLRDAMKPYGCPKVVVTDRLLSYRAAKKLIENAVPQETGLRRNNRAANSYQPFRRRERAMAKFRSAKSQQKFVSIHASVHNHRNVIFAAAKSSNSIARSPLPNGVKLPLETTSGSDFLPRPRSSDRTATLTI